VSVLRRSAGLRRRDVLKTLGAAGIGALTGGGSYGFMYERHHLGVTRETLYVSGWSEGLNGLKVGFLSDLHRSAMVPHELLSRAVELLMSERPDVIILGGDYVTWGDRNYVQPAADALAGLRAPAGVFAILGNHDDDRDMPAALTGRGFTVLRDARTQIRAKGEPLDLVGIRYWTRRVEDISRLSRGSSPNTILLAHTPARLIEAAALAVPLVLSGHTHGGQIVLPGVGAINSRKFPLISGTGKRENTAIFVTRGVGTVYVPVRLNCPPEVAVLTVKPVPLTERT
jgi:predicted MPP superfamily phosphohydrolase